MPPLFAGSQDAPLDPIMRLFEAFDADPSEAKLNLAVGVYTDTEGKVPCVRAAERRWIDEALPMTYRPIEGTQPFRDAVKAPPFGAEVPLSTQHRAATLRSVVDAIDAVVKG